MYFKKFLILFILSQNIVIAQGISCELPLDLQNLIDKSYQKKLFQTKDIKKNLNVLKNMCMYGLSFQEGKYRWKMLLVFNPKRSSGPFWFLPHDNENTAFSSAVYATEKYGGGFLAIQSNDKRYYNGQDPNRNFGISKRESNVCAQQKYPAPLYTKYIFNIIDRFKKKDIPYLSLHNNKNGWYGNGGMGGISILKESSKVRSYQGGKVMVGSKKGLSDEDSVVYVAGKNHSPKKSQLNPLLQSGMHVKYEIVNANNNDCSMSNYVVLNKGYGYYNIESEHGDSLAQKLMIDKLMKIIGISPLRSAGTTSNLF